jgi:ABC-type transport system involved in multi-copper enzyme maturation permease subunit
MSTLVIARLTFKEAARRKILLAALLLGLAFLTIFGLGFHYILLNMSEESSGSLDLMQLSEVRNFLLMAGLYVVNFLTIMMTVLTSVDTVSGEIASGTIHTLVSKPIRRWEIIAGKWLGFMGMITLYLVLMAGGVFAIVYVLSDYLPLNMWKGLALLWLNGALVLSVSFFGGTVFSTLANGVLIFGLYGIAFIGGWIEQIGTFLTNAAARQTAVNIGIITSLMLPVDAIWKRAAYEMQSPLAGLIGISPFSSRSVPSTIMLAYSVIYLAVMVFLALHQFSRRDL